MKKKTLRDVDVSGKRVLVRVDFNVPVKDGVIMDDTRIRAALPTILYLREQGAMVLLLTHFGRPKGKAVPEMSTRPLAAHLGSLLDSEVLFAADCGGEDSRQVAGSMQPGQVALLENTRFYPGEEKNDPEMARALAQLGELYVNDAFGAAHRAHASTEGVAHLLPAVAGFLMEKELTALGTALENPPRPFVAILGGAKVSDKIAVMENLLDKVDTLLVGGGMANTFLKAQGYQMGASLVEEDKLEAARHVLNKAAESGVDIVLPQDVVAAEAFSAEARAKVVALNEIPEKWLALDIGPATIQAFERKIAQAKTIVWNGPLGVYEFEKFAVGTNQVAHALAGSAARTIIGGGDVVAAVEKAGLAEGIYHISTGGGASLEFLEGRILPGVAALADK